MTEENKLETLINNIKDKNAVEVTNITKELLNSKAEKALAEKKLEVAKDLLNK
jgi:prolyl-tRNA editing enzyme YbaK/EbsC (Cys-tRNA(Pro) deacylase)